MDKCVDDEKTIICTTALQSVIKKGYALSELKQI